MRKTVEVYRDDRYVLGMEEGLPYLVIGGRKHMLTCHPYEPCLYITDDRGCKTALHNSFDPVSVLYAFRKGQKVTSITGREYDAKDFCRMVEYAADMVNAQIDEAERVFGPGEQKRAPEPADKKKDFPSEPYRPEADLIIEKDAFYELAAEYPDSVIDWCLVKNEDGRGRNAHWMALLWASRKLFIDDDGETLWHFDVAKADARQISVKELFAPAADDGQMNYRKAFLHPPYPNSYTDKDFDRINAALFPNGTDGLEVFEWTTGWSEYFDEGREWWGALCLSVYDRTLDRFVVIMASASD